MSIQVLIRNDGQRKGQGVIVIHGMQITWVEAITLQYSLTFADII